MHLVGNGILPPVEACRLVDAYQPTVVLLLHELPDALIQLVDILVFWQFSAWYHFSEQHVCIGIDTTDSSQHLAIGVYDSVYRLLLHKVVVA